MGLDVLETHQLVSQVGQAPVGNVCDPNYTMLAKIGKRYLPGVEAYGGILARLRDTGRLYQATGSPSP